LAFTEKSFIGPHPRRRFAATADPRRWVVGGGRHLTDSRQLLNAAERRKTATVKTLTLLR